MFIYSMWDKRSKFQLVLKYYIFVCSFLGVYFLNLYSLFHFSTLQISFSFFHLSLFIYLFYDFLSTLHLKLEENEKKQAKFLKNELIELEEKIKQEEIKN